MRFVMREAKNVMRSVMRFATRSAMRSVMREAKNVMRVFCHVRVLSCAHFMRLPFAL